jgi:nicotinamidase-related amidase
MSGMWGSTTPLKEFLDKEGIRTLFFTGVNTDQVSCACTERI